LDIERLQEERSFLKVLGAESIPDTTTAGDFLVRFSDADIDAFQDSCFGMEYKDLDVESLEDRRWIGTEIQEVFIQMDISGRHSINDGKQA